MTRSLRRRLLPAAVSGALVTAVLAGGLAEPASAAAPAAPGALASYLVAAQTGQTASLAADLRARGLAVTSELDGVETLVVRAPASALPALEADGRVAGVSADPSVRLQADTWAPGTDAGSLVTVSQDSGARAAWATTTGKGVDVALLDSGVSPVAGLDGAGKLVQGPDLSFDASAPALRHLDGFGHGTHMAGIIAGRDRGFGGAGDTTSFAGIAPDARIVSVKVADAYGNADVSQIIAGIDWVVQHKQSDGLDVRVLNLSLGLPSTNGYRTDPLAHAAEQAWLKGIVVVASAGNDGAADGQLLSPAYDPYVLAVGALDSRGTLSPADDTVADFSNSGTRSRRPDVLAPGRSIVSLRVPGSYLDQQYPAARVGDRYFRGSGTSQSAAVVSGSAALLLQAHPTWNPDMVKAALGATATSVGTTSTLQQGKGKIAVDKAGTLSGGARQYFPRSTGTGSLDAARGSIRAESGGVVLTGERDVFGHAWSSSTQSALATAGSAWTGGAFNGSTMTGTGFASDGAWAGTTWAGDDWAGASWATRAATSVAWDRRSWAGGYWSGRSWAGRSWAGRSWADESWG